MRPAPATAAFSLALALGHPGHAAGVFLPVGAPVPASQMARASGQAHQSRFVRIAHNELQRARAEVGNFGRSHLLFNMSEHVELDVAIQRTAPTLDGYTLSGSIDGGRGGFVTLAAHEHAVAGSIWTWEANYEVVPVGGGVHAVRVMDDPVECAGVVEAQSVEPIPPAAVNSTGDEAAVVDVLVFWTPGLEAAQGGESYVKLTIDLAIAYANDALERSGALVSLNLIGPERLEVEEVDNLDLLETLEGVHATERANTLGADFVSAFRGTIGGGVAIGPLSVVGPPHAYVFAHEVGHNLGVNHDRGAGLSPGLSYNSAYASIHLGHGIDHCHITAVAYATVCLRAGVNANIVPYYSTPNRYHPVIGTPLGVWRLSDRRGWDGPADAVLAINRNRHVNSKIRTRPSMP